MAEKKKKGGLGRGLDALFEDQARVSREAGTVGETSSGESVLYVDVDEIIPNKDQPRKHFDEDRLKELSDSIKEHGLIQPLVVRKTGGAYEIVAGERRWRACRMAGMRTLPCIVRELTDEENMLFSMIENLQREDLNPIEEAMGLQQMMKTYHLSQEQAAKSVSKSRPYVSNTLRLLRLPGPVRERVSAGEISAGHARALLPADRETQENICQRIISEGLSVRDVEKLVQKAGRPAPVPRKPRKDPDTLRAEDMLREKFGTKVSIDGNGGKGSIRLEFYSKDELDRLLEMLV